MVASDPTRPEVGEPPCMSEDVGKIALKKNIISSGEDEDGMRNLLGPPAEQVC